MGFLILLLLGIGVYIWGKILAGPQKKARSGQEATITIRTFAATSFSGMLRGSQFPNADGSSRQQAIRHCDELEELRLVPEPANPHDQYALKVCRMNGEQLGYWKGRDRRLCERISNGQRLRVTIAEIEILDDNSVNLEIRVEVLE